MKPMTPHSSKPPSAEFLSLTERYLSGEITPEELQRWETQCLENPDAFEYYLSLARVEGLLPEALERFRASEARVIPFYRRPALMLRLAAAFTLGALLAFTLPKAFRQKPVSIASSQEVPAQVTSSIGVRWSNGTASVGQRLPHASGAISAGLLELTLDSGVRLLVQGPAAYTVTGPNAVRLDRGRAVADVPLNARGFTLDSPRDRIIDHGTRFAVDVAPDGDKTTVGVLSGEVEFVHGRQDIRLFTDYAVQRSGDTVTSVPFQREGFLTETPSREFPWNLDGMKDTEKRTLTFDVTNLVHGPGDYRAVVRWLLGPHNIDVRTMRLVRGDVMVASASGIRSGDIDLTRANAPILTIAAADFAEGSRWRLELDVQFEPEAGRPPRVLSSQGVVSFEEGLSLTASAASFVGRWRYSHDGRDYVREFLPNGKVRLTIDGEPYEKNGIPEAIYTVAEGVLTLRFPGRYDELHMLRDERTLVFLNRPYRAASKE